jgi:hypothetical protein
LDQQRWQHNPVELLAHAALEPFFMSSPRSWVISAWYTHVPFAYWIVNAVKPRRLVELGTHHGVSYAAFCDAVLRAGLPTQCHGIDTWAGDEHAGHYGEEVYEDLRAFHDTRYGGFSDLIRSTFEEALPYFEDGSVDLLHIDGFHTYEAVARDFTQWRPKLSDRAVVLFHDTNVRERNFGVWRFWAELRDQYPAFEFLHGHGLGVLAYGRAVPDPVLDLCRLTDPAELACIRNRFAFSGRACIMETELARHRTDDDAGKHEYGSAVAARDHEIARLQAALAAREADLAALRSSSAWKLTAPARVFGELAKMPLRRLRRR